MSIYLIVSQNHTHENHHSTDKRDQLLSTDIVNWIGKLLTEKHSIFIMKFIRLHYLFILLKLENLFAKKITYNYTSFLTNCYSCWMISTFYSCDVYFNIVRPIEYVHFA